MQDVESVWRRCFPLIREKCRRMLGDPAEADDVAQETFVRLWQSKLSGDDPRSLVSWVYRTSTRLAIDRMRERARKRGLGETALEQLEALPSQSASTDDALQTRRELARLAQALPPAELEMALLHRLDGLTQVEIAEVMQISDRTVRRGLERFDQRVRALRQEAV